MSTVTTVTPTPAPDNKVRAQTRAGAWIAMVVGALYFLLPLAATVEFSLKMRRDQYSFDAYRVVLSDPHFQASFGYSIMMGVFAIVLGVLLVVPTAYWVQLRLPKLRPLIEFITLLPLVIPAIVIVFGYLHIYNSSSFLPLTGNERATDFLLICGYVTLCLPYMYRSVDAGLRAVDVRALTEAAECLWANWPTILFKIIFPNVRSGILSGAFLTFAVVIGEFTLASLLNRPAFGPYLQLIGANRAYEPSALAIIAFAITWASMGLIQVFGSARALAGQKI
jgi:putative spermidine/putrescine transport system permease protein